MEFRRKASVYIETYIVSDKTKQIELNMFNRGQFQLTALASAVEMHRSTFDDEIVR